MQHTQYPDQLATWSELRRLHFEEAKQLAVGRTPDLLTPLQRSLVAASRPAEELYDIRADPHETVNLAMDPAFTATLDRMRTALSAWREHYGDLGLQAEADLIESWRPGGSSRRAATPEVTVTADGLMATCPTPGSSIAWTLDPPGESQQRTEFEQVAGVPADDGRRWNLYTAPIAVAGTVWFQSWRLGFEPSTEIAARAASSEHGPNTEIRVP